MDNQSSLLVVGIAGGSGAGKTSLCKNLFDILSEKGVGVQVICHDSYYKDISHKSMEERSKTNFDHPDSLDTELLVEHIRTLKRGKAVQIPTYDFTTHSRTTKTVEVYPSEVIIIEGILILASSDLLGEMDLSFFVESRPDTRLGRRIQRDVKERGRSMQSVLEQFRNTVQPMYEQWVGPTKHLADFIISGEKWPTQNSMEFMLRGLLVEEKAPCAPKKSPQSFSPTNYLPTRMEKHEFKSASTSPVRLAAHANLKVPVPLDLQSGSLLDILPFTLAAHITKCEGASPLFQSAMLPQQVPAGVEL